MPDPKPLVYTWREGQLPSEAVRKIREVLRQWKIASRLVRKSGAYRLTIHAHTTAERDLGKHLYEGIVALWVMPDDGRLDATFNQLMREARQVFDPMARQRVMEAFDA